MHTTSGRWVHGLLLALLTALLWGILPIKLKQVLQVMDPVTVTWYRLLVSGGLLFIWLSAKRRLPPFPAWAASVPAWWRWPSSACLATTCCT